MVGSYLPIILRVILIPIFV